MEMTLIKKQSDVELSCMQRSLGSGRSGSSEVCLQGNFQHVQYKSGYVNNKSYWLQIDPKLSKRELIKERGPH